MAHFAELDENNIVLRVVIVRNEDTRDANGVEKESIGAAHCEKLLGGRWVQTSYNGNFRHKFAGTGDYYHEGLDAFLVKKPYPSWILDEQTKEWKAPKPLPIDVPNDKVIDDLGNEYHYPDLLKMNKLYEIQLINLCGKYEWNESTQNWVVPSIVED